VGIDAAFLKRMRAGAKTLSQNAVEAYSESYLNRPLEDHSAVKTENELSLRAKIGPHKFVLKPFLHQLACLLLGITYSNFLFFLDMGAAKTCLILNVIRWRRARGQIKRTLVLVPNVVNIATWVDQIALHAPELRAVRLDDISRQERQARMSADGDIWILNYAGLQSLMTHFKVVGKTKKGRAKKKREIDMSMAYGIAGLFDCVVYDESHRIGNTAGLTFKMCTYLSERITYRYGMTGTPHGRDPMLLWGQYFLVDHGETLGANITMFRNVFFRKEEVPWGTGFRYVFRKRMKAQLNRLLQHRAILYTPEELKLSLPPLLPVPIHLDAPKDLVAHFQKVLEEARRMRKGDYAMAQSIYMRMRQLASGFLRLRDVDDDTKVDIAFDDNPKIEATLEIYRNMPEDCKMVVFHDFLYSGKLIAEALDKEGVKYLRLYGETKDKAAVRDQFIKDPSIKVLVANIAAVGTGTDGLQEVANYEVFFDQPNGSIARMQSVKRLHRPGQPKTVYLIDLLMKDTWDDKINGYNAEGKSLMRDICEKGVDAI
jgi:SNF2 family DNA or RNA helicase